MGEGCCFFACKGTKTVSVPPLQIILYTGLCFFFPFFKETIIKTADVIRALVYKIHLITQLKLFIVNWGAFCLIPFPREKI